MAVLKYISSIINIANKFCQATRPKYVGQLSEMIQEYRSSEPSLSLESWISYYNEVQGQDKIEIATDKIWNNLLHIQNNLESLKREDVKLWVEDLIYNKTFSGLQIQLDVLEKVSYNKSYRLATSEEESRGIDGFIGDEPVSIKPISYFSSIEKHQELIECKIIYYDQTSKGIKIYTEKLKELISL
jgi:hypothetical protein